MHGVPQHRPESLGPLPWRQLEASEEFMEQREETSDVQSSLGTVGDRSGCREGVPRSQDSEGAWLRAVASETAGRLALDMTWEEQRAGVSVSWYGGGGLMEAEEVSGRGGVRLWLVPWAG